MKTTILKISMLFLLQGLMGAGCEKDNEILWEISPESKTAVIQKEVDGIEFKFCLLNEKGEPATDFNQGENFSFYFSVTNNRDKKLYFYPGFAYSKDIDFCKVYNSENEDLGKPYNVLSVVDIGAGAYPFERGETYTFQQQWSDNRESTWDWRYGLYQSQHKELLTSGSYYTGFKYRFKFTVDPTLYTDTLIFKIHFKIQ
ncbi:MAG: hypothetical protein Q8T08_02380 [Ignavibacteria bacterium]|nr:hypothetical protein [Ignavibacteria bacterium]